MNSLDKMEDYDRLKRERDELREELEALKSSVFEYDVDELGIYSVFQLLAEMKQRAEIAEAKLKAASEQKPVGRFFRSGHRYFQVYQVGNPAPIEGVVELYPSPTPPADVQETSKDIDCREFDGCPTEKAVLQRYWREAQKRIAELESKLDEWKSAAIEREALCVKVESTLPDIAAAIAKAREEGRKEADRDAERYRFLKSVLNNQCHPPTATLDSGNGWTVLFESYGDRYKPKVQFTAEYLDEALDAAMLAAAPKPEVNP